MDGANRLALIALICHVLLGVLVVLANSKRPTSRSFLLLTVFTGGWLVTLDLAFVATTVNQAALCIRLCSVFGYLILPSFALLRTSIIYYQEEWSRHIWRNRWWFAAGLACGVLSFTPFFLKEVRIPAPGPAGAVPEPVYGWADSVCLTYLLISAAAITYLLASDQFRRRNQVLGVRKVELQFVIMACLAAVAGIFATSFFQRMAGSAQPVKYAPLRVVVFDVIIAYGITSRGILHVRAVFRLVLSYAFYVGYVALLFTISWLTLRLALGLAGGNFALALFAAVATALLLNSTATPVRRITKRILPPDIDLEDLVTDVSKLVQSVATLEELVAKFSTALTRAVGSPRISVLLRDETSGDWVSQLVPDSMFLSDGGPIVAAMREGAPTIALEDLQRRAPTAERDCLLRQLDELRSDLVLPIRYHGELSGLLVFAERPSGRLYGRSGLFSLQIITEQLGVAIANSRLYTEARQSQAYNQFLVDHLTCGVIATDRAGSLNVVNPEARRLLGLDELAPPADLDLPEEIARLIPATLEGDFVGRDEEIILHAGARDEVNLRVSCLPFASEISRLLGAVLVLNDYSAIERLQRQIRQADRLASIGTLASGMAHEIKNPLTALKTFTQLLPKRYGDPEFRSDFALLGGNEILRIERIVNDLLAFARPAPLMIEPLNLHDIIAASVRLVTPQAAKLNIEVRTALHARTDFVAADRDRLQQVLLNLILNALQASEPGGWVELLTESEEGSLLNEPSIRLDVRDGGHGISKEMLPHIFDPFFTTKSEGTGLGLSVSYNIIAEHKGRMEVTSETGEGTCFSIYLPVA